MVDLTDDSTHPPGPTGLEFAGRLYAAADDPSWTFAKRVQEYGDVVQFPLTPSRSLSPLGTPNHVGDVLQTNHRNVGKTVTYDDLRTDAGHALRTSEDDRQLRRRRLVGPPMQRSPIETFEDVSVESVRDFPARVDRAPGGPVEVDSIFTMRPQHELMTTVERRNPP